MYINIISNMCFNSSKIYLFCFLDRQLVARPTRVDALQLSTASNSTLDDSTDLFASSFGSLNSNSDAPFWYSQISNESEELHANAANPRNNKKKKTTSTPITKRRREAAHDNWN